MGPAVDMSSIVQALARRSGGVGGGNPMPAAAQVSAPMGATPAGGPASPIDMPQQQQASMNDMPQQVKASSGALNAGQKAQGPQFDPETRDLAKALVQKLLKGM